MANMAEVNVVVSYKNNAVKEYKAFKELFSGVEEDVTQSYDIIEEYYPGDDELLELASLVDQTILNTYRFQVDQGDPCFQIDMLCCDWTFKSEWFDKLLERYFPNLFYYYEVIEPSADLYINTDTSRKYIGTEYALHFGETNYTYKEYYFDNNEDLFRILNFINCSNTKLKVPNHTLSQDELTALSEKIVNTHTNYKKNNEVIIAEVGITEYVRDIEAGDFYCSLFKFQDAPPCL